MTRASETPAVSSELVKALEQAFPDKLPEGHPDIRLIDNMIGKQEVIKLLRRWRDKSISY